MFNLIPTAGTGMGINTLDSDVSWTIGNKSFVQAAGAERSE